jgi:hypothetical protein
MTTDTRAVSAERGTLTPLVVLVPSLATVVGADFALAYARGLAGVVILVGLTITALVGVRWYSAPLVLGTALLTLGGGAVGTVFLAFFELASGLGCMSLVGGWWLAGAVACGALAYFAVATAGFQAAKYPLLAVVLALILGLIAMWAALAFAPQTQVAGCSS